MALKCQLILGLAGDAPLLRDIFSSYAHMTIVEWITEGSNHGVYQLSITHALSPTRSWEPILAAAHHLSSAAYCHFGITHINGLGCRYDRLQATPT